MGLLRTLAIYVLGASALTFIALFGRLPVFRKTPVGSLHRLIWVRIPSSLRWLDGRMSGGTFAPFLRGAGQYLMNEKHPLVLTFFLSVIAVSEILFIPSAWSRLSSTHRSISAVLVSAVYLFIFLATTTSPGIVSAANHRQVINAFQYDGILFKQGIRCSTCSLEKPARSKHCRICQSCVIKLDHHCVWINNCVGYGNYHYFLLMLASTSALLSYGCWLGYVLLSQLLQAHAWNEDEVWWKGLNITDFLQAWGWVITYNSRVGAVALLAGCTAPLAWGMLMYNVYLLWRGMTTNEHAKWKTLQDEAYDGELYAAHWDDLKEVVATDRHEEKGARRLRPPGGLVVVKTLKLTKAERESINRKPWVKLDSLENVTNMYDKGFMANIREAFLSKWDG